MDRDLVMAQLKSKDMLLGLVLTLFLGGFGLFYIGLIWGIIGSLISVVLWTIMLFGTIISMGFLAPFILFMIISFHVICGIIAAVSISSHNKLLLVDAMNRS